MDRMLRTMRWVGGFVLAVLLMAPSTFAQEAEDDRNEIVIQIGDDAPIVIVDGEVLSDEEAEKYLDEHDINIGENSIYVGPRGRMFVFQDEDDDTVRAFFREHDLEFPRTFTVEPGRFRAEVLADRLRNLDDHIGFFDDVGGRFELELGESMKERSEIAQMDMESRRLAQRVRDAEGDERERLEQELEDLLNEIFDRKLALRQERIERLRDELEEAQAAAREREDARQEIIDRRLRQLLGERDVYDW